MDLKSNFQDNYSILFLREDYSTSFSTLVKKSQFKKSSYLEYNLNLTNSHLNLILEIKTDRAVKSTSSDEGFKSDIDSLSLVSSDEGFTITQKPSNGENDSANGSSDSDTDSPQQPFTSKPSEVFSPKETFSLVNCVCYLDAKQTDLLIFVINKETLVFRFFNLVQLNNFYTNFTAVKALTNQKAYNKGSTKFNLLQRTDNNGITHIEITREELKAKESIKKSASSEDILKEDLVKSDRPEALRKIWGSVDDLDNPKRPERKKKIKPKAPPPPPQKQDKDIYSGQYVKVNVNFDLKDESRLIIKSRGKEPHPKKLQMQNLLPSKPTLSFLKKPEVRSSTLTRSPRPLPESSWTNSVPRLLKKKTKPEVHGHFVPMAYRYIDTTQSMPYQYGISSARMNSGYGYPRSSGGFGTNGGAFGNRLFGLSPKLRDFNGSESQESKWCGGDSTTSNLKSVIKKDETRKKNDKKMTFSAYTTVQVV